MSGLRDAAREADDNFHFCPGKAEALASAIVSLMLLAAPTGISLDANRSGAGEFNHWPMPESASCYP